MKINLIIPTFYPATIYGGPIFSTLHTCKELAKLENININVSTTNTNMHSKLDVETNKDIKFEDNFYVKYYDETKVDKFSLQLYLNVWKDIKSSDIAHIQAIFNTPVPVSLFYAKLFKKPIILSPRGSLGEWCIGNGSRFKNIWLNYLLKPLVQNITWHATAQQEKDEIISIYPNAKVSIIPNGIEYDKFQNSNILSKNDYMNKFTNQHLEPNKIVVSMGRLQKKKGFKIEIKMLFVILVFLTSILINDIDPKFNSEFRFITWIVMIAMIGPLFYSYHLNLFKEKLLDTFMYVFMILGAISFIYWLAGLPSLGRGHFSGLFGHSMVLAPISSMGTLYAIYRFYKAETNFLKYFYLILFLSNFLALVLSASRSALVAVLIALFIFLIFAKLRYKKFFLFFGVLIGIITNSFISLNLEKSNLTQSIATRGFDNTREILWHDRLLEFRNNPFFGVGFAAQDDKIDGKIGKKGSDEGVVEPGSTYLMILSMTGLLGAFTLLIFLSKYIINLNFWRNNLLEINYKILLLIFFVIHFIAEGYIFSSGSIFAFIFWLLIAVTYPNQYNNLNKEK